MNMDTVGDGWIALLALGAFHGLNPGMGWLFAVALGLQERSGRAVWRALPPLLAGHALSVAAAIAVGGLLGMAVGAEPVRLLLAATLIVMGLPHLRRVWHPRVGGMKVGARDLVVWSFLMATAHGAGLMALAFVPFDGSEGMHAHGGETMGAEALVAGPPGAVWDPAGFWGGIVGSLVHTAGYLLATGLLAGLVYHRLGLRQLQRRWINMDLAWAVSLVATGVIILLT